MSPTQSSSPSSPSLTDSASSSTSSGASASAPRSSLSTATPTPSHNHHTTTTTLPPLTTEFIPPASCTWTFNPVTITDSGVTAETAWLDYSPVPGASSLSCYPESMFVDGRTGVYSPATCPRGWTTAYIQMNANSNTLMETTTAVCCSSEYTLDGSFCKRAVPTILAVPVTYNSTASRDEVVPSSTVTLHGATAAVYTIQAMFRQSNTQILGLTNPNSTNSGSPHHPTLSVTARVGIGIGVALFVVLAIALGTYLKFRRERRSDPMQFGPSRRNEGGSGRGCVGGDPGMPEVAHANSGRQPYFAHKTDLPPPMYGMAAASNSSEESQVVACAYASDPG